MGNAASQELAVQNGKSGETSRNISTIDIRAKFITQESALERSKTRERIREENPKLRDVLERVGDILATVKQYEDNDVIKKTMSLRVMRQLAELNGYYFEFDLQDQREMIADALADCEAASSFVLYMNVLTDHGTNYPLEGFKLESYQVLRNICWNFSDASLTFCDELGRSGMLPIMLSDLQNLQDSFQESEAKRFVVLSAISILRNCAKLSNNAKYYREMNAIDTVVWYAKNTSNIPRMEVLAPISAMTLAFIVDEKHNDVITGDTTLIRNILKLLEDALTSSDHRCEGFTAVELMEGITKLASNADNSVVFMELGVIKHLGKLMKEGNADEQAAAAKATWVLSFSEKNKNEIRSNEEMVASLKEAAESDNKRLKNKAAGALWVLKLHEINQNQNELAPSSRRTSVVSMGHQNGHPMPKRLPKLSLTANTGEVMKILSEDEEPVVENGKLAEFDKNEAEVVEEEIEEVLNHVMISYQWQHQKLMTRLKARLEDNGYRTWMDIDEMGGSTLQSMAEAVENAAAILVCFSQKYKDSVSCRTEAEYAYKCKKKIIPLRVEQQYEADGWLGAILGAKFYYDFSNLPMFESMTSGLIKEIGKSGKVGMVSKPSCKEIRANTPVTKTPKVRCVLDWTNEGVRRWASERNLTTFHTKNMDGRVLLFLRQLKQVAPEFFYSRMSDQYGLKNIRDLMIFSEAIEDLS